MKICYDNLEGMKYKPKYGHWIKNGHAFVFSEACDACGESFLLRKEARGKFKYCSRECQVSDPKHHREQGKALSKKHKNDPIFHEKFIAQIRQFVSTEEHKKKLSKSLKKKLSSPEQRKRLSENTKKLWKTKKYRDANSLFKGGFRARGVASYSQHKNLVNYADEIRAPPVGDDVLQTKCVYCGIWFSPSYNEVFNRKGALEGKMAGEHKFYCSDNCRIACPTYKKRKWPEGFKKATSREVVPELRHIVLKRDNWECQKCGNTQCDEPLHVHHINSATRNKILSNDPDNCIVLCESCHKVIHSEEGCTYTDLKCA